MNTMHLFAGGGGGMYADLILGHTPVVAVEWEKACCDVLRARKEEWWPECEIIETDIRTFSGERYAGKVDCIHAGFPCQDISNAGKKAGLDGDRSNLFFEAIRVIREVGPRFVFLENVSAILSIDNGRGLGRVFGALAEIGYDNQRWTCLRASDIGANHQRDRWWCLARNSKGDDSHKIGGFQKREIAKPRGSRASVAHSASQRPDNRVSREKCSGERNSKESHNSCSRGGRQRAWGEMGWWSPEPDVGRVANGVAHRVNRLKMLGNGQVPLQAAYAWVMLGGPHNLDQDREC